MAKYVAEKMLACKKCGRRTRHLRNAKRTNWVMHLVLLLMTFGLWAIVMIIGLVLKPLNMPIGRGELWICEGCGSSRR